MRPQLSAARAFLGAVMALVLFVAVMPGTMAMSEPPAASAMADAAPMSHCDHMKAQKNQDTPCKGMKVCIGLLGCLGFSMVTADHLVVPVGAPVFHASAYTVTATGLTHPPDTPPPIV